jgi:2-keto-4-pentenoate hydratase/2-oxohepta-3-ene-1,7-dioic acid hydratase in catechol pathway
MKWCRFRRGQAVSYGVIDDGERVTPVSGSPFEAYEPADHSFRLDEVKLLAPATPTMIYAAGPNYRGHVEGMARRRGQPPRYPDHPEPNFRSPHAIIATEENIVVPKDCSGAVQPEGQLAVMIGKEAHRVSEKEALDYIFGYTIANDISQRPWQNADRTMFRAKNCMTFKPLGPWVVTDLDATNLRILVRHNGQIWEDFSSADQIWDTPAWIQEISRYTVLYPGDIIMLGTEGADGDLLPGDVIEVEVSGIGTLRNYVVAEE